MADQHKQVLGMLPREAFRQHADDGRLMAATEGQKLLGYLLYDVNRRASMVYIVHLCVAPDHRRTGVAQALVGHLSEQTRHAYRGIRVRCRKDFAEASRAWPRLGFHAANERPGRGTRNETTLVVWRRDFGHPDLLDHAADDEPSTLRVALDANVFYEMLKQGPEHSLRADWLEEVVEWCVTQELFNEISRQPDSATRDSHRREADRYRILRPSDLAVAATEAKLLPPAQGETEQDGSDRRHLVHCLAAGVPLLVTEDQALLSRARQLLGPDDDLRVLRPLELILQQEEIARGREFRPARLAGTEISVARPRLEDLDALDELRHPKQAKRHYRAALDALLSDQRANRCWLARSEHGVLAAIGCRPGGQGVSEITLLRATRGWMGTEAAGSLLRQEIERANSDGASLLAVTDQYLTLAVSESLSGHGFRCSGSGLQRPLLSGCLEASNAAAELHAAALRHSSSVLADAAELVTEAVDWRELLAAERRLWPAKLRCLDTPAFLVPIRPTWAEQLFDTGLAAASLFGAPARLMLRNDNVYYRAARPRVLSAPARIVWYVSRGHGANAQHQAARAVSYADQVTIAPAKELFSRFKHHGVYQWRDLCELAGGDLEKDLMAVSFSQTQMLQRPVPIDQLVRCWSKAPPPVLQGPSRMPPGAFEAVYALGIDRQ